MTPIIEVKGECMSSTGLLISLAVGLVIGLIIVWPIRHDIWKLIKSKKFILWSTGLSSTFGLLTYFEAWAYVGDGLLLLALLPFILPLIVIKAVIATPTGITDFLDITGDLMTPSNDQDDKDQQK